MPFIILGNTYKYAKNPYFSDYYYSWSSYDSSILSSHLVKSPAVGSWILNARGSRTLSVHILGFTGKFSHLGAYEYFWIW